MPKCSHEAGETIFKGIKEMGLFRDPLKTPNEYTVFVIIDILSKERVLLKLNKDLGIFL